MPERYMLIPWSRRKERAGDFAPKKDRAKWGEQKEKPYHLVYADHPQKDVFKFNGDTSEIVIYVRGHGNAGKDSISNGASKSIGVEKLCEMLIGFGLETTFAGRIKFYNCKSAAAGEDGELSFAARCAAYLRRKHYTNASYYGYTASVSGYYTEHDGEMHRWVTIQGSTQPAVFIGNTLLSGGKPTVARASTVRVPV